MNSKSATNEDSNESQSSARPAACWTPRNPISKSDITRLADIAKREQVMVELEVGGRIIRLSPLPVGEYGGIAFTRRGGVVL